MENTSEVKESIITFIAQNVKNASRSLQILKSRNYSRNFTISNACSIDVSSVEGNTMRLI